MNEIKCATRNDDDVGRHADAHHPDFVWRRILEKWRGLHGKFPACGII
jgi:hypothetical protein